MPNNSVEYYYTRMAPKFAVAEGCKGTLKFIICRHLWKHELNLYTGHLEKIVSIKNNRVSRMTNLAPITKQSRNDDPYLVFLCNTVLSQPSNLEIDNQVRIWGNIDIVHRGYRIQFTEELLQLSQKPTKNNSLCVAKKWTTKMFKVDSMSLNWSSLLLPHQ